MKQQMLLTAAKPRTFLLLGTCYLLLHTIRAGGTSSAAMADMIFSDARW
jgi:hypothetical protein